MHRGSVRCTLSGAQEGLSGAQEECRWEGCTGGMQGLSGAGAGGRGISWAEGDEEVGGRLCGRGAAVVSSRLTLRLQLGSSFSTASIRRILVCTIAYLKMMSKNDSSPAIRELCGFTGVVGNGRMLWCIGVGSFGTRPVVVEQQQQRITK